MLVLIGESASGKSSIAKNLVEKYNFKNVVTYTTRKPRKYETNGVDYHFIDKEEFMKLKSEGFFAETAMYNGWYYGSAKEDYYNSDNKIIVLTPNGLRQAKRFDNISIVTFYINVPRRDRLIKILERGDNIEEAYRRNLSDVGQFDGVSEEVDYVIDNPAYTLSVDDMTHEILNRIIF